MLLNLAFSRGLRNVADTRQLFLSILVVHAAKLQQI